MAGLPTSPPFRSPHLRTVASWWQGQARESGATPARGELDPTRLRAALAKVWLVQWDRAGDRLTYRLAGEDVIQVFGRQVRGLTPFDLLAEDQAGPVAERMRAVCRDGYVCVERGAIYAAQRRGLAGERLMLPLAGRDASEAFVLGVSDTTGAQPAGAATQPADQAWYDRTAVLAWDLT